VTINTDTRNLNKHEVLKYQRTISLRSLCTHPFLPSKHTPYLTFETLPPSVPSQVHWNWVRPHQTQPIFFRGVLTTMIQPQSTQGCGHLSGPGSQRLGKGLLWPGQSWQGSKGDSRDTFTFVTSCLIGMSLPPDSSCEGRISLHLTQPRLSMPAAAGILDEKGSEYILAHTGPRELDWHPLGGDVTGPV